MFLFSFGFCEFRANYKVIQERDITHPIGTLYSHDLPWHKWLVISINFVIGLFKTWNKHDSILVVANKLTKLAHFILGNVKGDAPLLAKRSIKEAIRLHGMPEVIISNRNKLFTSKFWTSYDHLGYQTQF